MLAEQFGPCPFKNAKTPENVFFAQANEYVANGNYTVTWAFNWTPAVDDWRAAVVDALSKYTTGNGSWDDVKTAFVEGWATQYANERLSSRVPVTQRQHNTGGAGVTPVPPALLRGGVSCCPTRSGKSFRHDNNRRTAEQELKE